MGSASYPVSTGLTSAVKSIQRGVASSAGSITITAVDTSKTIVNSFSTSAAGTAQPSGTLSTGSVTASGGNLFPFGFAGSNTLAQVVGYTAGNANFANGWNYTTLRYGVGFYNAAVLTGYNAPTPNTGFSVSATNATLTRGAQTITGGSTNLVSAAFGAYLSNSTTIVVTGPCRYEIVEYY
jgi:hypothetical protein